MDLSMFSTPDLAFSVIALLGYVVVVGHASAAKPGQPLAASE
jgi:hypothetical protein